MAGFQWDKAAREQRVQERGADPYRDERPPPARRARGISNDQARELARLERMLGEPYSGSGMTAADASRAINAALARLGPVAETVRPTVRKASTVRRYQRREQPPRGVVLGYRCPKCGADPGAPCIGARNPPQQRIANHAERVAEAMRHLGNDPMRR